MTIKGKSMVCSAHEAEGDERAEIWNEATQIYSGYETYAPRANRKIPVMVLTPVSEDA